MKTFLKLFFFFGVPCGLIMTFDNGDPVAIVVVKTLAKGAIFSLALFLLHAFFMTLRFGRKASTRITPYQDQTLTLEEDIGFLYEKSMKSLKLIKASSTAKSTPNEKIVAKTSVNSLSFGEIIEISFQKTQTKGAQVRISSRPRLKMTLLDWGNGYQNVTTLAKALSSTL